jgi:hypothetical protein
LAAEEERKGFQTQKSILPLLLFFQRLTTNRYAFFKLIIKRKNKKPPEGGQ